MNGRHQQRRRDAFQWRRGCGEQPGVRLPLTHPAFNLREIVKQMVLLEDHLLHPYKLCSDCVRKHLLTIEAFAEEAVTLDKPNGFFTDATEGLAETARQWMESFLDGQSPAEIAQKIRAVRKNLAPLVCDPRAAADRVASRHVEASTPCIHRRIAT